jgi:hypothetical protein
MRTKVTEITRRISADDRLKFFGLMKMAQEHTRETRKIELAIQRIVGGEDGDLFSDAIYARYEPNDTIADLDKLLLQAGIGVEEEAA